MIGFIDEHQDRYGIEPICGVLPIVPSTYYGTPRAAQRSPTPLAAGATRRGAEVGDWAGVGNQPQGLRGSQSVVAVEQGSDPGGAMQRGQADEGDGDSRG